MTKNLTIIDEINLTIKVHREELSEIARRDLAYMPWTRTTYDQWTHNATIKNIESEIDRLVAERERLLLKLKEVKHE